MCDKPNLCYGKMYDEDKYAYLRLVKYKELLSEYTKENAKVLDIGCYTANLYDMLPSCIDYLGIDFDDEALKIATQKGANVKKVNFENDSIDLEENYFDIIIIGEVLEHLINPQAMIDNVKRLLKDNGIVLISLPNECSLYHRIICLFGKGIDRFAFKLYKHLHLPTVAQSRRFVSDNFCIIKEDYFVMPSGKGSCWEGLGKLLSKIPYGFWMFLARISPSLFARGTIFIAKR